MLKHIVCFKLKDPTPENLEKSKEILLSMEGNVPQLRSIEVGIDGLHSERSYDIVLQVTLDGWDALEAYQADPYHCSVVKPYMHAVRETSVSMDYEME